MSRSNRSFAGLVDELDERLARDGIIVLEEPAMRRGHTLSTWAAFLMICLVVIGGGRYILGPAQSCEYSDGICSIAHLDIDALLLSIPDADLFRVLPSIDEIDPDDRLTLLDILSLEEFSHLDVEQLISPSELQRVLNHMD